MITYKNIEKDVATVFSLVLAGGIGSRMGNNDKPKQFLMACGKPIIIHTLEKFCNHGGFKKIIVLCPSKWVSYAKDIIQKYLVDYTNCIVVINGGVNRNDTIMSGINYIKNNYNLNDNTIIVTHDAARPFINNRIIDENIEITLKYGAATTAVPATDTILYCPGKKTVENVTDRSALYMCQTPQTFYAKKLYELYNKLSDTQKEQFTDVSGIFAMNNLPVGIVQGEMYNFKLTYPNDLAVAEEYIKRGIA